MSKNPTVRQTSVAAGTVGLAVVGAFAGAVTAHAAPIQNPASALPVSTNAIGAVKGLMDRNHGTVAGLPLQSIPVVGDLPALLGMLPTDKIPGLDGVDLAGPADTNRGMRARPHTAPVAAPAPSAASVQAAPATAAPKGAAPAPAAASPLDGITGLTEMLPMKLPLGGLEKSLPIGGALTGAQGLPLVGGLTDGLPGLSGASAVDPLGGLPLTSLSHLAG